MNLEEERRESAQCEDDKAKKVSFYQNHFAHFWFGFGSFGLLSFELDTSLLDCYNDSICTLIGA